MILKLVAWGSAGLVGLLAIVIGLNWTYLSRYTTLMFPSSLTSINLNKCQILDKSLYGCEDIVIHEDVAFLSCGNQLGRSKWFPPLDLFDVKATEKDDFHIYNFKVRLSTILYHETTQAFDNHVGNFNGSP
jgi:hypothetical protein